MKLFVGLGNPGREYERTRHNIGFIAIDELAHRWGLSLTQQKFNGIYTSGIVDGEKVFLLKPLTYMNLSGECVRPFMDYFNIEIEDLVVLYDEMDIPTGKLRLRTKGSAGGHNGIKSLIQHLGTQEFQRIRIGVDRPSNGMSVVNHVLSNFFEEEIAEVVAGVKRAADACEYFLKHSFVDVMNQYNKK
ncbi:aminoacyl-tRNA hydrolase [Bacillus sp. AFS055030]|uniref:aminoacyl-tRNA hydrolase n=1 Tax=Bacillus sp. AFS055030 TaxID=2033507 RepID=UPI000BFBCE0B|nr:aminoacyl-tRNA hydrolase [Bacillus sp. AFS055030]PGL70768.1 aminoacyl-tRNA hydrolase [Bacillus sp. AFS055030]